MRSSCAPIVFSLELLLKRLDEREAIVAKLDQQIAESVKPYEEVVERLDEVPGVDQISAAVILAEIAIAYGVYDTQANRGAVFVGTSHDTPAFAVDAIAHRWWQEGCQRYPAAHELFILADGGGSNGPHCRAWKKAIQDTLCNLLGLTVTVSHYPPGASKWNAIEHRLFGPISQN